VSTVILGASNVSQLKENLETLNYKKIFTQELKQKIDEVMGPASDID